MDSFTGKNKNSGRLFAGRNYNCFKWQLFRRNGYSVIF